MREIIKADRLAILTRHAITPANRAKYEGSTESQVQGLSVDMPVAHPEGAIQAHAHGLALGRFALEQSINIVEVHTSKTIRTITTRDLALEHMSGLSIATPSRELWEHRKGDKTKGGLEGILRSEAYPDKTVVDDWDYRHGTRESGGETPREAGERWLRWFSHVTQQANFQPRQSADEAVPTIITFGHNAITAYGITLLNHDSESPLPPASDRTFKVHNATSLLLAEQNGTWSVLPERLEPTPEDFEEARMYITER